MSVDSPGEPAITDQLIVHRRDVPQLTVYSWSRDGTMHSAWPGDGKAVPVDGCEIKLRIVAFPGGSVREIYLDKEARTHPHLSYEAVLFYQIDGRRVQMVNERSHELNPGDACLQPTGVQHSTFQLIGGLFVEFAFPAPRLPGPEATWIDAGEASVVSAGEGCSVKTFDFSGYPLVETSLLRGASVAPRQHAQDQIYYVVSGRMTLSFGELVAEVGQGDCMRSLAGQTVTFGALDDAVFIQSAIPA